MELTIVNVIQAMLAPGIMISACGLLLLGMNNKYSLVVNRIRQLDDEKRKLTTHPKNENLHPDEQQRLENVTLQINHFAHRVMLVKNAVIAYSVAVAFFIISSLLIGLQFKLSDEWISQLAIFAFLAGMISVLIGILFAAQEIRKGYQIVKIEISSL
ncbi:MAG: DUF2721 domain-containing protein [Lentimicrobiaceae bacterium]|nr:DUF2721 domain-containing protein [Lentimicrobiaceae bacterium]